MADKDTVVGSREVYSTKDYTRFKTMEGNRKVDDNHVKQIQKLMLENGNMTYEFPIVIDKEGYVIDGQHRLEALKELGWEVGYVVEASATIETVRNINRGNRNWSWRDVAFSYADRGNEHYKWFLAYTEMYDLRFSPALRLALNKGGDSNNVNGRRSFNSGNFEVVDKAKAHDMAKQVVELQKLADNVGSDFTNAIITIMNSPNYGHERMVHKMKTEGDRLPRKAKVSEYTRLLEDIYNFGYPEDNRVRLF